MDTRPCKRSIQREYYSRVAKQVSDCDGLRLTTKATEPIFSTFYQGQLVASLNLATLGPESARWSASRADLGPISGCF